MKKNYSILFVLMFISNTIFAQWNFSFNYNSAGQRVALVEATVSELTPSTTLHFIDSASNSSNSFDVSRRPLHGDGVDWILQTTLSGGTGTWTDLNVAVGDVWEYQVKRDMGTRYATGYVSAGIKYDQSNYKGRMILLIDTTMRAPLAIELTQLKKDLTGEGWFVEEVYSPRASGWYSADTVIQVKQLIQNVWNAAPPTDKPSHLFIIGHVPVPRSGLDLQAPDGHTNSNGAVGSDTYYADLDGVFTDDSTYAPAFVLYDANAYNLPNDFKWDQDVIPSELELAFGRIDFFEIGSYATSEEQLLRNYLNRLHDYRHVVKDMGEKTAFNLGYSNSYDGSYRSLIPISGADSVYMTSGVSNYPAWVKANGPFQAMLRNIGQPILSNWDTDGMDATIFASDQSYWGQWSMAETGGYFAKIRALLAAESNCLVALWQSAAINVFYQPGIGETVGMSCKRIMDHNIINNNIEKPEQSYDRSDFWNRTHMQYHGDPALRLFQVHPITNLTQSIVNGNELELNWTASIESSIVGYHVYKSTTEFGQYQKISTSLIAATTFTDVNFSSNDWYMVKAIKLQTTGSGTYLNPSTGVFIKSSLITVQNETVCFGGSIVVNGTTYDANNLSGTETFLPDSIVQVSLTVLPELTSTQNETVCFGGSISVNGTTYDASNLSGTEAFTNIGAYNCDSVVSVNLTIQPELIGTHTETVCFGGSISVNGTIYDASNLSGTETFNNIGAYNCDSTVEVNLTINSAINVSTTINEANITADQTDALYKWLDCNKDYDIIANETSAVFTSTSNGEFAVEITLDNCIDTSSCVVVSSVEIFENSIPDNITIYPNPTTGIVYIDAENIKEIEITNINGQRLKNLKTISNNYDLSTQSKGIYFIKIVTNERTTIKKIILK